MYNIRKKNYRQTHKMDYMLFACLLKVFLWQLIDKFEQTKLFQELKIVTNLEKSELGSYVLPLGGYSLGVTPQLRF